LKVSCGTSHCCAIDNLAYPHCWADHDWNKHLLLPTITYKEYIEASSREGWIVRDNREDFYEDDSESKEGQDEFERKDDAMSLVQFRQLAVSDDMSCGITLLGSNLLCWGPSVNLKRGLIPRQTRGPFRQLSLGGMGFCAISAEMDESDDFQVDTINSPGESSKS
jgi:hypothetical protein